MDEKKLQSFTAVMKYRNLADAASETYMSESAISKHIHSLETEFNTSFFTRRSNGMYPTKAAYLFFDYANQCLKQYQDIMDRIQEYNMDYNNVIRLGTTQIMSEYELTDCLVCFSKKYPDLCGDIVDLQAGDVRDALINKKVSVAIVSKNVLDADRFDMITIRKDSLVAVLPENHPLSNASAISINDLRRERFISPGRQSAHRFLAMDLCKKHGFEPRIVLETTQLNSVMDYIRQGVGICLMMKQVAKDHMIPGDRIVPLAEHVSIAIVIARLKSSQQPEKIQLLWNFIDDYFTLNRSHA